MITLLEFFESNGLLGTMDDDQRIDKSINFFLWMHTHTHTVRAIIILRAYLLFSLDSNINQETCQCKILPLDDT